MKSAPVANASATGPSGAVSKKRTSFLETLRAVAIFALVSGWDFRVTSWKRMIGATCALTFLGTPIYLLEACNPYLYGLSADCAPSNYVLLGNTVFIWTLLLINIIVAATVREKRGLFIYKYHIFTVLCGTGISGSLSYVAAYLRAYKSFKHGLFRPWSEDPLDVVRTAFGAGQTILGSVNALFLHTAYPMTFGQESLFIWTAALIPVIPYLIYLHEIYGTGRPQAEIDAITQWSLNYPSAVVVFILTATFHVVSYVLVSLGLHGKLASSRSRFTARDFQFVMPASIYVLSSVIAWWVILVFMFGFLVMQLDLPINSKIFGAVIFVMCLGFLHVLRLSTQVGISAFRQVLADFLPDEVSQVVTFAAFRQDPDPDLIDAAIHPRTLVSSPAGGIVSHVLESHPEPIYLEEREDVSMLCSEVSNFESVAQGLSDAEALRTLHLAFSALDRLCQRIGLLKYETVGKQYLTIGNFDSNMARHELISLCMAITLVKEVSSIIIRLPGPADRGPATAPAPAPLRLAARVGLNAGPISWGVVGLKRRIVSVVGQTINLCSRLLSVAADNHITMSADFAAALPRSVRQLLDRRVETMKGMRAVEVFDLDVHRHMPALVGLGLVVTVDTQNAVRLLALYEEKDPEARSACVASPTAGRRRRRRGLAPEGAEGAEGAKGGAEGAEGAKGGAEGAEAAVDEEGAEGQTNDTNDEMSELGSIDKSRSAKVFPS